MARARTPSGKFNQGVEMEEISSETRWRAEVLKRFDDMQSKIHQLELALTEMRANAKVNADSTGKVDNVVGRLGAVEVAIPSLRTEIAHEIASIKTDAETQKKLIEQVKKELAEDIEDHEDRLRVVEGTRWQALGIAAAVSIFLTLVGLLLRPH